MTVTADQPTPETTHARPDRETVEAWILAIPLAATNVLAAFGQSLWTHDQIETRLDWPLVPVVVAVWVAVALESIALVLSSIAHRARMAGDAALPAQVGAYTVALVVGVMNYSHWADDWSPTGLAVVFAGFSVLSPWLWGTWSKAKHRADLRARGLVDPRSVRFALARWVLFPGRTFWVLRAAVWEGETDPAKALLLAPPPRQQHRRWFRRRPDAAQVAELEDEQAPADDVPTDDVPTDDADGGPERPAGQERRTRKAPARRRPKPGTRTVDPAAIRRAWDTRPDGATQASVAEALGINVRTLQRNIREPEPPADGEDPAPALTVVPDTGREHAAG